MVSWREGVGLHGQEQYWPQDEKKKDRQKSLFLLLG